MSAQLEQLEGLSTGEIEALIDEARSILDDRRAEQKRLRWEKKRANAGEGGSWLEHELVSCGKCSRCLSGEKAHGPYWYVYRYTGSKMVSSYVGRKLSEDQARSMGKEELAALKPEEAFPGSYPRS